MNQQEWLGKVTVHLVAMLICVFIVLPIMLLIGDRSSPYVYLKGDVETKDAVPGQLVYVKWSGKYTRNCDGQIFRSIIDSGKTVHLLDVLPSVLTIATPGENSRYPLPDNPPDDLQTSKDDTIEFTRAFTLPLATLPGRAYYRVRSEYWCNPLQHYWPIKVNLPDIPFNVVPRPTFPLPIAPPVSAPPRPAPNQQRTTPP